jgi:hypothetical protein
MTSRIGKLSLCGLVACYVSVAASAEYPGGAKIVRVSDGTNPRCINPTKDEFTITLTRILVSKERGWFTSDSSAGIQVTTSVTSVPTGSGDPDTSTMNRVYIVKVQDYSTGQVSLPLEGNIVGPFRLTNQNLRYGPFQVSASLMKGSGDTPFGSVVRAIAQITKESVFPAAPTNAGYKLFGKLTESVLADENNKANGIDAKIPTATINLSFSRDGSCTGDISETTGTFAVVFGSDKTKAPGYVDIKDETNYCFSAQKTPSFALLVGKKSGNTCTATQAMSNDYMMFYKSAFDVSNTGVVNMPKPPKVEWASHGAGSVADRTAAIPSFNLLSPQFKSLLERTAAAQRPNTSIFPLGQVAQEGGLTVWKVDAEELLASDYVAGLRRCEFNDVATKECALPSPPRRHIQPFKASK